MSFWEFARYGNMEFLLFSQHPALAAMLGRSYCGDGMHDDYNDYACEYPNKVLLVDRKNKRAAIVHYHGYSAVRSGYKMKDMGPRVWEKICEAKGWPKEGVTVPQESAWPEQIKKSPVEAVKQTETDIQKQSKVRIEKSDHIAKISMPQYNGVRRGPLINELNTRFDMSSLKSDTLASTLTTKPAHEITRDIDEGWMLVESHSDESDDDIPM